MSQFDRNNSAIEAPIMVRTGNVAASRGSGPGLDARRLAALLLLAALAPATAVAQRTPQPVFAELFAYDPAEPSQLLGKWRISSQLDSKLQPLRVGVVEDPIGMTVGRVTVQEGDGLEGASDAMLRARRYVSSERRTDRRRRCHGVTALALRAGRLFCAITPPTSPASICSSFRRSGSNCSTGWSSCVWSGDDSSGPM